MNKTVFTIFGSGFGLYGYLPALLELNHIVILQERYRLKLESRTELSLYAEKILWVKTEEEALIQASGLIIALDPKNQELMVKKCLSYSNIKYVILEKPLATSPQNAKIILNDLIHSGKQFKIGYNFRFTHWGKFLLDFVKETRNNSVDIKIYWKFKAYHYKNELQNWKRDNKLGGGVIRFYGIHFIALLAEIGYDQIKYSNTFFKKENDLEKWHATFINKNLSTIEVYLDTNSNFKEFLIEIVNPLIPEEIKKIANQVDPFTSDYQENSIGKMDDRIPILSQLIYSLYNDSVDYSLDNAILNLWENVENANVNIQL